MKKYEKIYMNVSMYKKKSKKKGWLYFGSAFIRRRNLHSQREFEEKKRKTNTQLYTRALCLLLCFIYINLHAIYTLMGIT